MNADQTMAAALTSAPIRMGLSDAPVDQDSPWLQIVDHAQVVLSFYSFRLRHLFPALI